MTKHLLTVLQRKAGADRPLPEYGVMSPAKALRLALAQAGDDLLSANILAGTVEESRTTVARMPDLIEPGSLVMLLDGGARSRGLAILDAGALAAAIEALTTGRISEADAASSPRMPTATDAFLCGRFVTRVVNAFATHLAALPEANWAEGFSATEQIRDARSLPLILEDVAYRMIAAPIDFDAGKRSGMVRLLLPWGEAPVAIAAPAAAPVPADADSDRTAPEIGPAAEAKQALLQAELSLEAVLTRQRKPLSALLGWSAGDLVTFPASAISAVALIDAAGTRVATARLGQVCGQRALKLLLPATLSDEQMTPLTVATARRAAEGPGEGAEQDRPKGAPSGQASATAEAPERGSDKLDEAGSLAEGVATSNVSDRDTGVEAGTLPVPTR